jgi:hypothetical protein
MNLCTQTLTLGTLNTDFSLAEVGPELGALATRLERLEVGERQLLF